MSDRVSIPVPTWLRIQEAVRYVEANRGLDAGGGAPASLDKQTLARCTSAAPGTDGYYDGVISLYSATAGAWRDFGAVKLFRPNGERLVQNNYYGVFPAGQTTTGKQLYIATGAGIEIIRGRLIGKTQAQGTWLYAFRQQKLSDQNVWVVDPAGISSDGGLQELNNKSVDVTGNPLVWIIVRGRPHFGHPINQLGPGGPYAIEYEFDAGLSGGSGTSAGLSVGAYPDQDYTLGGISYPGVITPVDQIEFGPQVGSWHPPSVTTPIGQPAPNFDDRAGYFEIQPLYHTNSNKGIGAVPPKGTTTGTSTIAGVAYAQRLTQCGQSGIVSIFPQSLGSRIKFISDGGADPSLGYDPNPAPLPENVRIAFAPAGIDTAANSTTKTPGWRVPHENIAGQQIVFSPGSQRSYAQGIFSGFGTTGLGTSTFASTYHGLSGLGVGMWTMESGGSNRFASATLGTNGFGANGPNTPGGTCLTVLEKVYQSNTFNINQSPISGHDADGLPYGSVLTGVYWSFLPTAYGNAHPIGGVPGTPAKGQTAQLRDGSVFAGGILLYKGTTAIPPSGGGTGLATLTANAVLLGQGTSNVGFATIGTGGRMLLDKGAGVDPAFVAMSGNATLSIAGVLTIGAGQVSNSMLANSGLTVTAGTNLTGGGAVSLGGSVTLNCPTFVASGASHAAGAVPDPGSSAGTTKFLREDATWGVPPGTGTVTSVGISGPSIITWSNTPVTTTGTLTGVLANQSANTFLGGATSGGAAAPTFRVLVAADYPVFIASGASHAVGAVPDPGSSSGTTKFLREDASWAVPPGTGGSGTVTSVGLTVPGGFSVSGSPVTTSGTLAIAASCAKGDVIYGSATNTYATLAVGSTGQVLTVASGVPSWATPATTGLATPVSGTVSSPISVSSNTVAVSVTGISFSIAANETWAGLCNIRITGAAAGAKLQFTGPAGATSSVFLISGNDLVTAYSTSNATALAAGTTQNFGINFNIANGANAGTVQLKVISVTNTQTNTVAAGSQFFAVRTA